MRPEERKLLQMDPRQGLAEFAAMGLRSGGPPWQRQLYKTLWMRARRADPVFRKAEQAARRADQAVHPQKRESKNAGVRDWRARHRFRVGAYNRRYHRTNRQRRCFFCRRNAGRGPGGGLKQVERMVIEDGELVPRTVLWCGC